MNPMAVTGSCVLLYSIAKVLAVENRLPYIPKNEQQVNCRLALKSFKGISTVYRNRTSSLEEIRGVNLTVGCVDSF